MLLKTFTEPDEENIDELAVVDGVAEFVKLVGERLEPLTINPTGESPWTVLRSSVWRVLTRASMLS